MRDAQEETIKGLHDGGCYNVALYIDYENVYKTLRLEKKNIIRLGFFEHMRIWCQNRGRRIVKIAVYCNYDNKDLHESHHQSLLQSYGVEPIHTSYQGKNFADLQITIDVLNAMYLNSNIDEFIIMSNDKDMAPLLNTIRLNKRKASIITTGNNYNKGISNFSDEQITLNDIINEEITIPLEIDEIKSRIYESFVTHIEKKLYDYLEDKQNKYSHYELQYNLVNQMDYFHIMIYEMANIFLELKNEGKIMFYNYDYKGGIKIGVLPSYLLGSFIDNGIIIKKDITDFNLEEYRDRKYDEKY